jgi:hypothetical protein
VVHQSWVRTAARDGHLRRLDDEFGKPVRLRRIEVALD